MAKRPLGMLARFINGAAFKPSDWGTEGYPIIRIQNLTGSSKTMNFTTKPIKQELMVKKGDILVSWSATLGVYKWEGPEAVLNQHIFKVVPAPEMLPEYLFYAIGGVIDDISSKTHGSTMKHVVRGDFEDTLVYAPPLAEQQRIVEILDRAAAIQRLRKAAEEKVREIIPALFVDMFGDPEKNPKGWPIHEIRDLFAIKPNYGTMTPASENPSDYLCIRVANIQGDRLSRRSLKYLASSAVDGSRHIVMPGDLLLARAIASLDHLGKCLVANPVGETWAFDSHIMRCRFDTSLASSHYVANFLRSRGGAQLFCQMLGNPPYSTISMRRNLGAFKFRFRQSVYSYNLSKR
jgi:type I restriction enzyme S subunit